jgi:hypothetical protein
MAESLLQLGGSQSPKPPKNVPLTTSLFFSGIWSQRSPFGSPDSRYYSKFLGGRTDILIDGSNTELTNYGTLIRRPGLVSYSSASLGSTPLSFYSFHPPSSSLNPIIIIADTITNIYTLNPSSKTSILTKAIGSGQSFFQGVGQNLYIGDGVDLQVWTGGTATRNWGIVMNNSNNTTGPNACGAGADVAVMSGTAWANPGNITVADGAFAVVTLPPPSQGSTTAGPLPPGTASVSGAGAVWSNLNNIKTNDAVYASSLGGSNGATSQELQASNYAFGVPANATISGIQVDILRTSTDGSSIDNDVTLLKANVATGNNKAVGAGWPIAEAFQSYGGPADLWGTTWSSADVNSSGFGVQLSVTTNAHQGSGVDFVQITITYTVPSNNTTYTDLLEGTNFGFNLSLSNTISGILVEVKGLQTSNPSASNINIGILKNSSVVGTVKATQLNNGSNAFISLGGSSDLWGTSFSPGDINSSTFGVYLQGQNSSGINAGWSVDFIRVTIFGTGGPTVATNGTGGFNAITGYQYIYAYGNSNSGHVSNPTPPSANTGPFGGIISASTLGNGGTGYVNGDTGIINAGKGNATYTVNSVGASGNVLTYTINSGGTSYVVANNVPTAHTGAQAGVGGFFSINITAVTGIANVQVTLTASTDPQVNQIRVFRTKDGGSTFFELPSSPYPNTSQTISDSASDSSLQLLTFFTSSPWLGNSPPPAGLGKMTYHLSRVWGVVGNVVYFSALLGDDITLGVGPESWPPVNSFTFPNPVNRLLPIATGLLVFTSDDVYIIIGNTRISLFLQIFQQGVGLLSYNALDVEGNLIFLYTSDRQFIGFSASGPMEFGYAIGVDLQTNFDPTKVYVAALVSGTQDKAVFISDGTSNWYRCNWNQAPEGGPAWSPKASIVGGATAVVSVETSPGNHQLLVGQNSGSVLARSYSIFSDNGSTYTAFATIGSLVLAKPGQLAALDSVVLELQQVGSIPTLSLMLDEISGNNFETLIKSITDPPRLSPSQTVMSRRWYLSQGQDPRVCRHIQVRISFIAEALKNELLTLTAIGALMSEE